MIEISTGAAGIADLEAVLRRRVVKLAARPLADHLGRRIELGEVGAVLGGCEPPREESEEGSQRQQQKQISRHFREVRAHSAVSI